MTLPRQFLAPSAIALLLLLLLGWWSPSPTYAQAPGTFVATGSMSTSRGSVEGYAGAFTLTRLCDGRVLAAGGTPDDGGTVLNSAEVYNPTTGLWSPTGVMATARYSHGAVLLPNCKVLVAGGVGVDASTRLASAELWDPATGLWSATGSMLAGRGVGASIILLATGKVLVAGGQVPGGPTGGALASSELYDPATGLWTATGALNVARGYPLVALLQDGRVLAAGGWPSAELTTTELYSPTTGTWTRTGSMAVSRTGLFATQTFTLTALADGRVLAAGGVDPSGSLGSALASAEIFTPGTGLWAATTSMPAPRTYHSATLLADGRVLVAGGLNAGTGTTALLFDAAAGPPTWTPTAGSLTQSRGRHAAVRLLDGRVLLVGPNATAELFISPTSTNVYLHASGSTLFLNGTAPTAPTAQSADSAGISFNGGNLWKDVGTWTAAPSVTMGTLTALAELHIWLGLKNSDDQGTSFDLRAEVYKNGVLVASGVTRCITGVTRNPNLAKEALVAFAPFAPVTLNGTSDVLSLKVSTRIGTNPDDTKCPGHNNATGLRVYFDAVSRPARFGVSLN